MKKSLAIAAATMFAVASYSAQLNWAMSVASNKDQDGNVLSGATVALVMADSSSATASDISYDNGTITGGKLIDVATLGSDGKFATPKVITVDGSWGSGKYLGKDFDGNATSVTAQGTGTSNAVKYFTLIFDGTPTAGNFTVLSPAAATTIMNANATIATTAFTTGSGSSSNWQPVPEPTVVALLALGLAALGLKRKVA